LLRYLKKIFYNSVAELRIKKNQAKKITPEEYYNVRIQQSL
jgi:hypothetical protein